MLCRAIPAWDLNLALVMNRAERHSILVQKVSNQAHKSIHLSATGNCRSRARVLYSGCRSLTLRLPCSCLPEKAYRFTYPFIVL
jgi:hypothetical protein